MGFSSNGKHRYLGDEINCLVADSSTLNILHSHNLKSVTCSIKLDIQVGVYKNQPFNKTDTGHYQVRFQLSLVKEVI